MINLSSRTLKIIFQALHTCRKAGYSPYILENGVEDEDASYYEVEQIISEILEKKLE